MGSKPIIVALALASAVALAAAVGGCAEPRATLVGLPELVPVADTFVFTESIELGASDAGRWLAGGWAARPFAGKERGRLVLGLEAVLFFDAVVVDDLSLEIDLRPFQPDGVGPQRLAVAVNGHRLRSSELDDGWNRVRVDASREIVVPGHNEIELRFARAPRPADHLADSEDDRRVAALVRRVRIRPPSGRSVWSTSRPEVEWSEEDPSTLSMPTDSLADFYFLLPSEARLQGGVEFDEEIGAGGTARWTLEVAAEEDAAVGLLDLTLESTAGARQIDVGLERWAGAPIRLRMRAVGETNGRVVARDLRITAPASTVESSPPELPELEPPPDSGRLGRPDVYVILLDAARADGFSCYGSPHATPAVDALASSGTRFARAYAPSAWTGQSVPALLTGRYPDATGSDEWVSRLPDEVPTLAELLADAGYRTALFSQHALYRGNETLRRGFETVTVTPRNTRDRLPVIDEWVDPEEPSRPIFALVHLLPPHGEYRPPDPFRGRLTGWYEGETRVSTKALRELSNELEPGELSEEEVRYIRLRYQENVLYADRLVDRFLERLREAGRLEEALVFLVSDHGEAFWEHGRFLHTHILYEEVLRIPFVVRWPRGAAGFTGVVEEPVGLIDVAPTVIDGLGLGSPGTRFQGRSLLEVASGGEPLRRPVYALTKTSTPEGRDPRGIFAFRLDRWKLIYDRIEGDLELYDLEADPGENEDLATVHPIRARFMLQRLSRIRRLNLALDPRGADPPAELKLDPDVVEELRALGYLQ